MAKVLIADTPETAATLQRIMDGHDLTFVNTLDKALKQLSEWEFDLVLATLHFDSSRMFEFFSSVRQSSLNCEKPIICFCSRDTDMTRLMHKNLECSTSALGAWMYLDEHAYNTIQNPDAELRRVIERCLSEQYRTEALRQRIVIYSERTEIHRLRKLMEQADLAPDTKRLAEFRHALEVLRQRVETQCASADSERANVRSSRNQKDRVSDQVATRKNDLTELEETQSFQEMLQTINETEISQREDLRLVSYRSIVDNGKTGADA